MARDFYPFVEEDPEEPCEVNHPARIAIYDDPSAAPRVVVVEPKDVRGYLEEITATVSRLAREQGGTIPFMVIREIVENFIHAYFQSPTITILDSGNTIRFSDQGPGIKEKALALEYGTSSATEGMKRYIRGVGSGLPYVQQYMTDKGGSLEIEDNIAGGTVVTISTHPRGEASAAAGPQGETPDTTPSSAPAPQQVWPSPAQAMPMQPWQQSAWAFPQSPYVYQTWPQTGGGSWPSPHPQTVPMQEPPSSVPSVRLTERDRQVLSYLSQHESVGPTELVQAYGSSSATWSRTLAALAAQGLVIKEAQKYRPTAIGRAFL